MIQENKRGWIFSLEEELWIMDLFDKKRWFEVKTPYEFVSYKQLLLHKMLIDGLDWSCVDKLLFLHYK